jgi:hypothetical protein
VVRFDTYKASAFLVWQLKHAGAVIQEDGGDIIQVRIASGETIRIHLIESSIPVYEIKNTLADNDASGIHTLFLLWCDMLLPTEGHVVEKQDWEIALAALYGERIYAYDLYGSEMFIFPVHYDPHGAYHHIRYGKMVGARQLFGEMVETWVGTVRGRHRVAGFAERAHRSQQHMPPADRAGLDALAAAYALLGVRADAEPEDVKTAFRRIARKIHPDVNPSHDATRQMQALNEAYRRIMNAIDDDTPAS